MPYDMHDQYFYRTWPSSQIILRRKFLGPAFKTELPCLPDLSNPQHRAYCLHAPKSLLKLHKRHLFAYSKLCLLICNRVFRQHLS